MDQSQTFFSKISTRKERERAFTLMVDTKSHLECQLPNKKLLTLKADHLKDALMIVFLKEEEIKVPTSAIITFSVGTEKYFMKTTLHKHDLKNHYYMDLEPALFKLQRRNSFRVQIPPGYHAKAKIIQVNEKKVSRAFVMADLSGGGFSFEMTPDNEFSLEKDQIVTSEIEIGGKYKRIIKAIVKHVIKVGSQGSGLQKVGLEFIEVTPKENDEIVKLVMDLHRDMFSKFKIGSR